MIDLSGKRFTRLVVINKSHIGKNHQAYWLCLCDCGKKKIVRGDSLKAGSIRSCSCLMREKSRLRQHDMCYKHGKTGTKVYTAWKQMEVRCNKKTDKAYFRYGARGIKVLWKSFEEFYRDMGDAPSKNHSIDRINNNGPYSKENCRWATQKEQANNRRTCVLLTFKGKTQNMKQWAEELGVNHRSLWYRLKSGWGVEKTLSTPIRPMSRLK